MPQTAAFPPADRSDPPPLSGQQLPAAVLLALLRRDGPVQCDPAALARMETARQQLLAAVSNGQPVYGVSRGVGPLKSTRFEGEAATEMTRGLLDAHTAAVGQPYPAETVRLAMILKLNSLLTGRSGASPALAQHLAALLSHGITPEVAQEGSIGCGDILPNGQLGAALTGQGFGRQQNDRLPMAQLLARAGLPHYIPSGKDALALISHNALTLAHALQTAAAARTMLDGLLRVIAAAAVCLHASPTPWRVAAAQSTPEVRPVANWLTALHATAAWPAEQTVHDPLELRFLPEIFGPVYAAVAEVAAEVSRLSGLMDENPAIIDGKVLTSGASHCLGLALRLETLRTALAHAIRNGFNQAILLTGGRRAGLPLNLVVPGVAMTGFGPFMKLAGATATEAIANCSAVSSLPLILADGLEDEALHHSLSLQRLDRQIILGNRMAAIIAILTAQAQEISSALLPPSLSGVVTAVRDVFPFQPKDLPMAGLVETVESRLMADDAGREAACTGLPYRDL